MPALNFQPWLAPFILDGSKPHTIRALRKHPISVGHDLRLYTGQRTRNCQMLRDWTPCLSVQSITIARDGSITLGGKRLSREGAAGLIWRDGFRRGDEPDSERFYEWFCGPGLDQHFEGVLISWARHELLEI